MAVLRALVLLPLAALFAVLSGVLELPMPYPGTGHIYELDPSKIADPHPQINNSTVLAKSATRLFEGILHGSESVAVDSQGTLVMLDKFGYLWESKPVGDGYSDPMKTGYVGPARPLGMHIDADDNIIICDTVIGLTHWNRSTKQLRVLTNIVSDDSPLYPGLPLNYANDLDVAPDGTIYFTTSTDIPVLPAQTGEGFGDTMEGYLRTMYQGKLSGKVLSYHPETRKTHVIGEGLYYANGVALSADGSFLAIVETCTMSVQRFWLKGPKTGTFEVLATNLPGFPDGITMDPSDGTFYIAILAPPTPLVPYLKHRGLRTLLAYLPPTVRKAIVKIGKAGIVVHIKPDGEVIRTLTDPTGDTVWSVSSVTVTNDKLFFGCLSGNFVSYVEKSQT